MSVFLCIYIYIYHITLDTFVCKYVCLCTVYIHISTQYNAIQCNAWHYLGLPYLTFTLHYLSLTWPHITFCLTLHPSSYLNVPQMNNLFNFLKLLFPFYNLCILNLSRLSKKIHGWSPLIYHWTLRILYIYTYYYSRSMLCFICICLAPPVRRPRCSSCAAWYAWRPRNGWKCLELPAEFHQKHGKTLRKP